MLVTAHGWGVNPVARPLASHMSISLQQPNFFIQLVMTLIRSRAFHGKGDFETHSPEHRC
jgi:hypothetical protein